MLTSFLKTQSFCFPGWPLTSVLKRCLSRPSTWDYKIHTAMPTKSLFFLFVVVLGFDLRASSLLGATPAVPKILFLLTELMGSISIINKCLKLIQHTYLFGRWAATPWRSGTLCSFSTPSPPSLHGYHGNSGAQRLWLAAIRGFMITMATPAGRQ
jgi:hypothetical protein